MKHDSIISTAFDWFWKQADDGPGRHYGVDAAYDLAVGYLAPLGVEVIHNTSGDLHVRAKDYGIIFPTRGAHRVIQLARVVAEALGDGEIAEALRAVD